MIFHPAIIGLFFSSILIGFMVLYCAFYGIRIIRRWDILSGSELQLSLERRTYLISTFLSYIFGFQLLSLFLFIFTADQLHPFFVGAMCAAGSLYANSFGYPVLLLKILNFFMAGLWLILNHADNQASDYPLIRKKYIFLLALAPFILAEAVLQAGLPATESQHHHFLLRDPVQHGGRRHQRRYRYPSRSCYENDVLWLHDSDAGLGHHLRPEGERRLAFCRPQCIELRDFPAIHPVVHIPLRLRAADPPLPLLHSTKRIRVHRLSPVPDPVCGSILGVGVGVLIPFKNIPSLADTIPALQKRMTLASLILLLAFAVLIISKILFTDFTLDG